jgi:hypothetical protein
LKKSKSSRQVSGYLPTIKVNGVEKPMSLEANENTKYLEYVL